MGGVEEGETPIERAVRIAGGPTALMRQLNERGHDITSHNTVLQWVKGGTAPAWYCPDIEDITGEPCEGLCPRANWQVLRGKKAKAT